jgi:leucyl-tRNA synthetase
MKDVFGNYVVQKMFEKGLAYRGKALSNWCPIDQTVLANEHIEGGKCWRCQADVLQKEVEQWFLAITKYADDLIWKTPPQADWPKQVREGQNNWIGKSEGMLLEFKIEEAKASIEVFTTRPETTDGATFLVVAPEHEFITSLLKSKIKIKNQNKGDRNYVEARKTEWKKRDRTKSGIFSRRYVKASYRKRYSGLDFDYVLAGYGTGAIMAVPTLTKGIENLPKSLAPIEKQALKQNPKVKR